MQEPSLIEQLATSLREDRSSENRQRWAKYIVNNNISMRSLLPLLDAEHPIGMRFTWLFGDIVLLDKTILNPIVLSCFQRRNDITSPGNTRTLDKLLCLVGVPEELEGTVVDELFKWILDPKIKVAVKVFAIDTIAQLAIKYPALKEELLIVLDDQWDKNSVAFRARGRQVRKRLEKIR